MGSLEVKDTAGKYTGSVRLASAWESMTAAALRGESLPLSELQNLLKATYAELFTFHQDSLIPKGIGKMLLEMDSFLYFISLMESKEVPIGFYHYPYISAVVAALKNGFFNADYPCAFPKLRIQDSTGKERLIDFETDIFAE